jgi:beta-lactamase class A
MKDARDTIELTHAPKAALNTPTSIVPSPKIQLTGVGLKETVEEIISGNKSIFGIVIKNLHSGESYSMNEHVLFDTASLYKLWVMATIYDQIEKGRIRESGTISQDVETLNEKFDIDPELAEQSNGTISLRISDALYNMIAFSDNYAAMLLSEKVRLSSVTNYLKEHGFNESKLGEPPTTTAADIALFFEKLYQGELANEESTSEMIALLKKQTLNKKLPRYLDKDVIIAHKTGELGTFSHDAGIVYSPTGDYLIVILSDSEAPKITEDSIGKISKAVYEYFQINN